MTIQPIGAGSAALFLTPADLDEYGVSPHSLTHDLALALTRAAFRDAGLATDGAMEIEAYPDACGVLLFVRLTVPERTWFIFEHVEDLIAAARGLSARLPEAALFLCDGHYWLAIPADDARSVCRMTEFALPAAGPFLEARVAEYGAVLLPGGALQVLLHWFPN